MDAHNGKLDDAAIALHRILSAAGLNFGIFGGYACSLLGGPRLSKDVDCMAHANKARLVALINGKDGFRLIPQTREDYVAFFWSVGPRRDDAVLVELFPDQFPGM